ncbi:MAG: PriCT-2 domain-containing protein [Planctomycetaceae bacterium]|nr:PriCT-2 domain-containing protein [Planctomycetaceae bacterium]
MSHCQNQESIIIVDYIDLYRKHFNAKLFPLRKFVLGDKTSKQPLEADYLDKDYSDEELRAYVSKGHSLGWSLGPRDIVADLDVATAERPDKQGDQIRPLLENLLGDARFTTVVEAPSGGRHYYLRLPDGVDSTAIKTKIRELPSVDILRFRNYVVIAGSNHWQGGQYEFSDETKLLGFFDNETVSPALIKYLQRDEKLESKQVEQSKISTSLLDGILSVLPVEQFRDHASWFSIMCGCHHVTEGSDEGLESFLKWSLSDPQYFNHQSKIEKRWKSLDPHKTRGYTLGTLLYELRQFGREDVVDLVRVQLDFGDTPVESIPGMDFSALDIPTTVTKPPASAKPRFEKTTEEMAFNDQIIQHLAKQDEIYARLDQLVYVSVDGTLHHRKLSSLGLCEYLSSIYQTGTYNALGMWKPSLFTPRTGTQIVEREQWKDVKSLRRITPMPIISQAGLHQTIGYDPITGLYYYTPDHTKIPKVPRSPSREMAQESLAIIIDLIDEFPFADPCHRSAWLASLLGIVARPMLGPCAPMTVVDGNRSGAGKGMLCDLIGDICLAPGGVVAKFTGLDKDETEQRKMFLALARENPLIGVFDNFKSGGSIGSPVLDAILTTGSVSGRVLGLTKIDHAEFDTTLFATANRIQIDPNSDLLRRIFYILLETRAENPEKQKFKYSDIRAQARKNRGMYLAAALTIMEYARTHRDSLPEVTPWGSYTGYDIVRRVLVDLGEPDPRDSVANLRANEGTDRELALVIEGLKQLGAINRENGLTSAQLADKFDSQDAFGTAKERQAIHDLKEILIRVTSNRKMSDQIGNSLKKYKKQASRGEWLVEKANARNSKVWWVESVE